MLGALPFLTSGLIEDVVRRLDAAGRRLRSVERHPETASAHDVELLVRAHGTREEMVWAVVDRMDAADLAPAQVWAWTLRNDGIALAELLASSVSDDELVDLLGRGEITRYRAA